MLKTSYSTKKNQEYSENFDAIVEIAKRAKLLGLSYGQYVAQYGATDQKTMDTLIHALEKEKKAKKPKKPRKTFTKECVVCGKTFETTGVRATVCSNACRSKQKLKYYYQRKEDLVKELTNGKEQ